MPHTRLVSGIGLEFEMIKLTRIICLVLALAAAVMLYSCGTDEPNEETTFVIDRTSLSMTVGDIYTMSWSSIPTSNDPADVTWESQDPEVVTCEGGVIVAVGEGRAIVTATHKNGRYSVCSISVSNEDKKLYMLEGESLVIKNKEINAILPGANCISTSADIATSEKDDVGVVINASCSGKAEIRIETEKSSLLYYDLVVLPKETSGINMTVDEFPITVNYDNGKYQTTLEILEVLITKYDTREYLNDGIVQVELTYVFRKVYDSEGSNSNNVSKFNIEVYSEESDGYIRTLEVNTGRLTVDGGETKEFTYIFNAVLANGDGERNFTFKVTEAS